MQFRTIQAAGSVRFRLGCVADRISRAVYQILKVRILRHEELLEVLVCKSIWSFRLR